MFLEESQNRTVDNLKRKKNTILYKAKIVPVVTELYSAAEQTSQTTQGEPDPEHINTADVLYHNSCLKLVHHLFLTDQHLVHDDPKWPPVTKLVVASLHENFGGNVIRSTHSRKSLEQIPPVMHL